MSCSPRLSDGESIIPPVKARHLLIDGATLASVIGQCALAVPVIRWGADTSSDKLRQRARCTSCGRLGATIQHPGWAGTDIGFAPFPVRGLVEPTN
jgi:hypothetical protein